MKQQSSRRRSRNNRRGGANRNQAFDSNGPDVRIRGTASQVYEKYCALAQDALSSGDKIVAENYFQHAEHYLRVVNEQNAAYEEYRSNRDSNAGRNRMKENFDDITETDVQVPVSDSTASEGQSASA